MFYKPEVREKMQHRRQHLDAVTIMQASQEVAAQLVYLKEFLAAKKIAGYFPMGGELDALPIMRCAQTLGKQLYLPVLSSASPVAPLKFCAYQVGDPLQKNRHGINEPHLELGSPISPQELQIIFLPLLAFDRDCNRLGRGAGHYDRTLAFIKQAVAGNQLPCLIGLAYEFQKIEQIKVDNWDIPLDIVVTEEQIYYRKSFP